MRWPAKVLFLSQPLMAKLCGPRRGGPQTGGSRRQRVPRGRQKVPRGQGEESDVLLPQGRVLPLVRSWGTPRAEAAAPSQTKSSSRAGPHGLHQSGGSPGARRVTERRGLFPPSDWKLRLGAPWGIAAPPSSARRPHPSESSGAGGSARKPLGSGERLSPSGLHRAGPRPRSVHPRPAAHSPGSAGFRFSSLERRTLPGNPGWRVAVFLNQPALQMTFLRVQTRAGHLKGPCWASPGGTTAPTAGATPRPDPPSCSARRHRSDG